MLVAGGGPVGLATAILAARAGREVVIVEPRAGVIDKACGEGLMPAGRLALAELGLIPEGVPFTGICYRDHACAHRLAEGDFPSGPGLGVRRTTLHAGLRDLAAAEGVRWVEGRVAEVEQRTDSVGAAGLHARWLVAADGLRSPIRHALGLDRTRPSARFGMRQHFQVAPWSARVEVHWRRGAEAYVTPVAPDTVGVAFLFQKPARFDALLTDFPVLRAALGDAAPSSRVRGAGPFPARARRRRAGRVLLVGDAAGYPDPLTGEGISVGLHTARAAVGCIVDERPDLYDRRWRQVTRRYFWLTGGLLRLTRPRCVHRPLIGLLGRSPRLFRLALGLLGDPR